MSTIQETQGAHHTHSSYYCQRCKAAFMAVLLNNNGKSEHKIVTFKNNFEGRFLICGHAVNVQDLPVHVESERKVDTATFNTTVDPAELRQINIDLTKEVYSMSDDALEAKILNHVEEYKLHMITAKKEKYKIQMLEDLVQKRINSITAATKEEEQQIRRNMEVKYGNIFRRPEKRLELQARDKVKAEKAEVKKVDDREDAIAKMRALLAKTGLKLSDLGGSK